ncbi:MAG: hypothetical protein QOI24_953 [Acidobacteriota bacterium]|jgi:uncharacterized protein (DUF1697 family)|nr:hypothetical protein [Acidobacteriota bacterium]
MRYVAFLRAINVGGHVVKMDRLRGLFEELGLASVETFIASGNVIFESRAAAATLEPKIAKHLRAALGYEVATFLRTIPELATIAAREGDFWVGFLDAPATTAVLKLQTPDDELSIDGRELYWKCHHVRYSDSTLTNGKLEKALGMPMTMRNVTTVRKLAAKYS